MTLDKRRIMGIPIQLFPYFIVIIIITLLVFLMPSLAR